MKKKLVYETPLSESTVVRIEGHFMDASYQGVKAESMDVSGEELDW